MHEMLTDMSSFVVTGCSTGIGEACARRLAEAGHRVFAGVRKEADAEAWRGKHAAVRPILLDVRDEAAVRRAAAAVSAEVGPAGLQGLVNNAGIAVAAPLEYLPIDDLRTQLDVNVVGQLAVTQAFLPLLRQGRGRIVFISSISGLVATPITGAYAASKSALEALADALRMELSEWGLEVVVIEPGQIATPIWDTSVRAAEERQTRMDPESATRYGWISRAGRVRAGQGAKRGLDPSAVARAVEKALLDARPRTRYLVAREWLLVRMLAALPDRWRDRMILGQLRKMAGR